MFEYKYRWLQILNEQYIKMNIDGASTIFGPVSMGIEKWIGHCYA